MGNVSLVDGHIDGMTNYDRIRNMSVEEMSDFLMDWALRFMQGKSPLNVEQWLESEVDTE